ncbi:uncharacterized protein LOC123306523 [Coccinella septempunctata]|uniref:uncharacterized protein LOC123306523 n=1 Tax=Coccinella septempunctata TaxID=41139 RepID=UPI001D07B7E2|nr:uncharacterized protein LOC123306523 [Coccinella septempunctata]
MEELFHSITKILAHNIVVHVYSLPNFSIESFITSLICVVHILLIMEVNSLVSHITEKSIAKLRRQRIMRDDSKPNSSISLQSGDTHVKMQHHLRKYYENHSPFIPPNYSTKKLTKIPEMQSSDYNWIPTTVEEEKYEKIDQILSVSPSDYIKKDKEKKIHENELRHCLKSLTTLLECSVASRMSTTSLAKSISIIRDHLKTTGSNENIAESNKKATENNRKTTDSLFDMMERSLTQSAKEDGVTSHGDRARRSSLEGNFSIYSSPSDTSAEADLDSQSNITEVK